MSLYVMPSIGKIESMPNRKLKICLIFGTRPEIIKLSPVIRALQARHVPYFMIHTGQHFSFEMDRVFFKDLELPEPKYQLMRKSSSANLHAEHTGHMMDAIEKILLKENPTDVLVQGDTNSVLAGALAASKIPGVRIGHIEAGLRSYDRQMPEEINRIVADHVSHTLFAPTKDSAAILLREGIEKKKIFVTGNTIVDAVIQNDKLADKKVSYEKWLNSADEPFFLMTIHRQENVDERLRLTAILKGVGRVADHFKTQVVFPIHPRTAGRLKHFGLSLPDRVRAVEPCGFLDFLWLEKRAGLLLSDSGGVQEEGCILCVPCVTLRTSTERPETVEAGANLIAGFNPDEILRCAKSIMSRRRNWRNPFGDGRSAERILKILSGASR